MAQFYEGGSAMFDALVYSRPHERTLEFLQHSAENFYHALNDAGRQFTETARSFYDGIGLSYGAQQLQALGRTISGMWQSDQIRPLATVEEFQNPPPAMRRWIMAEPTTRKLYHQQRVDGYSNQYVDYFTDEVGEDHYDYRRATTGVVMEAEDGSWVARSHFEDLIPGDQSLTQVERNDIQSTWEHMRTLMAFSRDDLTNSQGGERG